MKRRDVFLKGTLLATAGLAAGAAQAQTVPAQPRTGPHIFEFGARGDGTTDDSAAFKQALQVAAKEMRKVVVPAVTYGIHHTIAFTSTAHTSRQWGLDCQGAVLLSTVSGGDGLRLEGNAFECQVLNSYFQDCGENGGATDVRVIGGYCRENKLYGFYYNNGTAQGASIQQVGFENNCKSKSPGDPTGAHIFAQTCMQVRDCAGYNEFGGATYLLRGYFSALTTLDDCSQTSGGAMKATGKTRLVQVNGPASGHVVMRECVGGLDVASGSSAGRQKVNAPVRLYRSHRLALVGPPSTGAAFAGPPKRPKARGRRRSTPRGPSR